LSEDINQLALLRGAVTAVCADRDIAQSEQDKASDHVQNASTELQSAKDELVWAKDALAATPDHADLQEKVANLEIELAKRASEAQKSATVLAATTVALNQAEIAVGKAEAGVTAAEGAVEKARSGVATKQSAAQAAQAAQAARAAQETAQAAQAVQAAGDGKGGGSFVAMLALVVSGWGLAYNHWEGERNKLEGERRRKFDPAQHDKELEQELQQSLEQLLVKPAHSVDDPALRKLVRDAILHRVEQIQTFESAVGKSTSSIEPKPVDGKSTGNIEPKPMGGKSTSSIEPKPVGSKSVGSSKPESSSSNERVLLLTGVQGMGKTTCACDVLHNLVSEGKVGNVLRISEGWNGVLILANSRTPTEGGTGEMNLPALQQALMRAIAQSDPEKPFVVFVEDAQRLLQAEDSTPNAKGSEFLIWLCKNVSPHAVTLLDMSDQAASAAAAAVSHVGGRLHYLYAQPNSSSERMFKWAVKLPYIANKPDPVSFAHSCVSNFGGVYLNYEDVCSLAGEPEDLVAVKKLAIQAVLENTAISDLMANEMRVLLRKATQGESFCREPSLESSELALIRAKALTPASKLELVVATPLALRALEQLEKSGALKPRGGWRPW
jgi:hypothetical protein